MSEAGNDSEREKAILGELADLGLVLARDLQKRALAAADDAVAAEMALAFHRVSRSVRQSLALAARLERDRHAAAREAANIASRKTLQRVQRRRQEVRDALTPLIWTETEGDEDEAETLFEALESRLMAMGPEDADFADQPLDACIAAIRTALGLAAETLEGEDELPAPLKQNSA